MTVGKDLLELCPLVVEGRSGRMAHLSYVLLPPFGLGIMFHIRSWQRVESCGHSERRLSSLRVPSDSGTDADADTG